MLNSSNVRAYAIIMCAAIALVLVLRLNNERIRSTMDVSLMGLPVSNVDTTGTSSSKFLDGFRSTSRLVRITH